MPEQKVIEVDVSLIFDKILNQWQVSVANNHGKPEMIPGTEPNTVVGIMIHINNDPNKIFKIGFAVDEGEACNILQNTNPNLGELNLFGDRKEGTS